MLQAYHTVAAALNAYHNILLKNLMGDNEWSITAYNHPLPRLPVTEVCVCVLRECKIELRALVIH